MSWVYFICRTKLNYTQREAKRLTLGEFSHLYTIYKADFDLEMRLKASNTTYEELSAKISDSEEWL